MIFLPAVYDTDGIPVLVSSGQLLKELWFSCLWLLVLISASVFALLTDDGPYSKGSKDSGGMDAALVSRRQSIPGKGGDQLLLQNIGASITVYLDIPKMGKPPQNTNFDAFINKAFAGKQKWMVVTGLSEWCVTGTIPVLCGPVDSSYRELGKDYCTGLTLTKKKTAGKERGKKCCHSWAHQAQGGRLAVSGKLRISHIWLSLFWYLVSHSKFLCEINLPKQKHPGGWRGSGEVVIHLPLLALGFMCIAAGLDGLPWTTHLLPRKVRDLVLASGC